MMATELRVRTCLELVLNEALHSKIPHNAEIQLLSGSYRKACIDSSTNCAWTSVWGIIGAAHAIRAKIQSIYPPLNGLRDLAYRRLNLTIVPSEERLIHASPIQIAWTKVRWSKKGGTWWSNHFSAIIPEEEECIEQAETSMIIPTDSVTVRDSQDENQQANIASCDVSQDDLDQDNISFLESSPPRLKKPKAQSTPIKAVPAPKMDDISFKSSYNVNDSGSDIID